MPDVKDQKEKNRRSDKEYSSTGRLETGGALTTTKRMWAARARNVTRAARATSAPFLALHPAKRSGFIA